MNELLQKALDCFHGNHSALARAIDPTMSPMAISHWKIRGIPSSRFYQIELATQGKVTAKELHIQALSED